MSREVEFNVRYSGGSRLLREADLREYAQEIGLDSYAPGRFSWLFVVQLWGLERQYGVSAGMVMASLRECEGQGVRAGTKPASQFLHAPLKGLWHKHYFSPHFIPRNILTQLGRGRLAEIVRETLPEGQQLTEQMLNLLAHRVTVEPFEQRASQGRLTGEWIIFAEHGGANYYLTLGTHDASHEDIYAQISAICFPQFPFLAPGAGLTPASPA